MQGDREKSLQAGMNDHVTKPIDPAELCATLVKWIEPVGLQESQLAEPEPSEAAASFPVLPGIATETALARLDGNGQLYRRLLTKFAVNQAGTVDKIEAALHAGDLERARLLAHTLKGVTGNIGAETLQAAAGALETALRGEDETAWDGLLEDATRSLNEVLASLSRLEPLP
jgi:polar amino acid transport system substrate-binding protein